jgi:hypothetical protein
MSVRYVQPIAKDDGTQVLRDSGALKLFVADAARKRSWSVIPIRFNVLRDRTNKDRVSPYHCQNGSGSPAGANRPDTAK